MSELIDAGTNCSGFRWKLLATASTLALLASISTPADANADADDAGRPTVWIELGGQLERTIGGGEAFAPLFFSHIDQSLTSPTEMEKELPWSIGPEGKLSFQPDGSDWVFSASIRYGRTNSRRSTQQKTKPTPFKDVLKFTTYTAGGYSGGRRCCVTRTLLPSHAQYADVDLKHEETHGIVDFQAGRDVGLGLFGRQSTSVLSAGIRFAQFNSKTNISVKARTDMEHYNYLTPGLITQYPQRYKGTSKFRANSFAATSTRSVHMLGPSISWDASVSLAGAAQSDISFDWGVNAAVLFGRQKVIVHHQTSAKSFRGKYYPRYESLYVHGPYDHSREHSVVVPNVGGFAGVSFRYSNAKVRFGYRGDFFLGAVDNGIDTRISKTLGYHGPFATISIGLGG
jgi:hypothetical protein